MPFTGQQLFDATQAWATANGYVPETPESGAPKYSEKAQKITAFLRENNLGGYAAGVYKLMTILMDEPLPPMNFESESPRETWNDEAEFPGEGIAVVVVPTYNIEGHEYKMNEPVVVDDDSENSGESINGGLMLNGRRNDSELYVYEVRPATLEECERVAQRFTDDAIVINEKAAAPTKSKGKTKAHV